MDTSLPLVLVVEDDTEYQMHFAEALEGRVALLGATSLEEAETFLPRLPDVSVVVMDGCVPGNDLNTIPLVQRIRRDFGGPIIACSSKKEYRRELLDAGCSHECAKEEIPRTVLRLLESLPARKS